MTLRDYWLRLLEWRAKRLHRKAWAAAMFYRQEVVKAGKVAPLPLFPDHYEQEGR